jgi:cell division protein FtsB
MNFIEFIRKARGADLLAFRRERDKREAEIQEEIDQLQAESDSLKEEIEHLKR